MAKAMGGSWFRFSELFFESDFCTEIEMRIGDIGVLIAIKILADVLGRDGKKYKKGNHIELISHRLRCDKEIVNEILEIGIKSGIFVDVDGDSITSIFAIESREKSEIARDNAQKRIDKQDQNEQPLSNRSATAHQPLSKRSAITVHDKTVHDKKKQQQERGMQGGKQTAFFGEKNSLPPVANFAAAFFGDLKPGEEPEDADGHKPSPTEPEPTDTLGKTELLPETQTISVAVAEMPDNYETTTYPEISEFDEDEKVIGSEYIDEVLDKIIELRGKSKGVLNPGGLKRSLLQVWRENPKASESDWADEIARDERLTSASLARNAQIAEVNEAIERRIEAERKGLHVEDPTNNEPDTILGRFARLDKEKQCVIRELAFEKYRKNPENLHNVNFYYGRKIPTILIAEEINGALNELFGGEYDP